MSLLTSAIDQSSHSIIISKLFISTCFFETFLPVSVCNAASVLVQVHWVQHPSTLQLCSSFSRGKNKRYPSQHFSLSLWNIISFLQLEVTHSFHHSSPWSCCTVNSRWSWAKLGAPTEGQHWYSCSSLLDMYWSCLFIISRQKLGLVIFFFSGPVCRLPGSHLGCRRLNLI